MFLPTRRPLTHDEVERVCDQLRSLHYPWDPATQRYLHGVLTSTPSVRNEEDLKDVTVMLERLYARAFIVPKSNIGTLSSIRRAHEKPLLLLLRIETRTPRASLNASLRHD